MTSICKPFYTKNEVFEFLLKSIKNSLDFLEDGETATLSINISLTRQGENFLCNGGVELNQRLEVIRNF